jgi:hypothetical protein
MHQRTLPLLLACMLCLYLLMTLALLLLLLRA